MNHPQTTVTLNQEIALKIVDIIYLSEYWFISPIDQDYFLMKQEAINYINDNPDEPLVICAKVYDDFDFARILISYKDGEYTFNGSHNIIEDKEKYIVTTNTFDYFILMATYLFNIMPQTVYVDDHEINIISEPYRAFNEKPEFIHIEQEENYNFMLLALKEIFDHNEIFVSDSFGSGHDNIHYMKEYLIANPHFSLLVFLKGNKPSHQLALSHNGEDYIIEGKLPSLKPFEMKTTLGSLYTDIKKAMKRISPEAK